MIDADTALERIRWHAESGASVYHNMDQQLGYECARIRLLSILGVFDQFDGSENGLRPVNRIYVERPIRKKLVICSADICQLRYVEVLRVELSEALALAVNDNRMKHGDTVRSE